MTFVVFARFQPVIDFTFVEVLGRCYLISNQ